MLIINNINKETPIRFGVLNCNTRIPCAPFTNEINHNNLLYTVLAAVPTACIIFEKELGKMYMLQ